MSGDSARRALCPDFEDHTPCPEGYLQWHAWAEDMMRKGFMPRRCTGCKLYTVWEQKRARTALGDA